MMQSTYTGAQEYLASGRDKSSRPLANNTRVESRGDAVAIRLHGTDVVTYGNDETITLNSGGWRTNTTADRIRTFSPAMLYSERGVWYIRARPDASDPQPERLHRSILHPFDALDPGPEPVKPEAGCIADTETVETFTEEYLVSNRDLIVNGGTVSSGDIIREYDDSDYFAGYAERSIEQTTVYGENAWRDYSQQWVESGPVRRVYKQCEHCARFDRAHELWDRSYNGERWGNRQGRGYRQYTKYMTRFGGDVKAWREAARDDVRAVRARNVERKEWEERNRVLFDDGMTIASDGYADRPDPKAIAREQRKLAAIGRKRARIAKFVNYCMTELAAGNVPMPSGGDCWGCCMRDQSDRRAEPMGTDHLEQHIRERYAVPSMFVNAMLDKGYRPEGVGLHLGMSADATHLSLKYMRGDGETIKRALMHYLTSRLLPEHVSR